MNALFVSYAYPPLRFPRAVQVARLVAHLPWTPAVLCADEPTSVIDPSLAAAYADRGRVVRVPWSAPARAWQRLRDRTLETRLLVPDRFRPWQRGAERAVRRERLLDGLDVLVTFGQPMSDHLLGLRLARGSRLPWIAHFSDPWADNPYGWHGPIAHRLNRRLEAAVLRRADAVVFTSEETRELVTSSHGSALAAKSHVLHHAHDPALYPAGEPRGTQLVVRSVGSFYRHRGPEPLADALRALCATSPHMLEDVRFELVGSVDGLAPDVFAGLPDGLVARREPVGYLESLALMRDADLLLLVDAPAELSVFLPSKLVDYLGARRPILAITPPGAAASLVRRAGGAHADPRDPAGVAAALAEAIASVRAAPRGEWGDDQVVAEHAAPAIAARFAEIVDAVRRGR